MAVSTILCFVISVSGLFSLTSGGKNAFARTILEGASEGMELAFGIAGPIALWCGVGKLAEKMGLLRAAGRVLHPLLVRLFPGCNRDEKLSEALSANLCMNLFGLGNAATPMGIRAAQRLSNSANPTVASDGFCRLVVLNTASLQLLPTTVAAIRAEAGAFSAFDIVPCVWITSLCSVTAGLLAEALFHRGQRHG